MIKNNLKGLEFKKAFFAVILLSMTIIAIGVIIVDWDETYQSGITYDLDDYDNLDEISTQAGTQRGNISVRSEQGDVDFEGTSIRGVFGILSRMYNSFNGIYGNDGMIDKLTDRFGIPLWIRQGIVTIIVISITFALISIFFGRRKP